MPDSDRRPCTALYLLSGYAPRGVQEAADLTEIRAMLAGAKDPWSQQIELHLTASAVVVHPPTNRVLLRWHPHVGAWLQVGGHGDPGESDPIAITLREALEETGLPDLVPWPDASLLHAVIVPVGARPGKPAHRHADLRFVLATEQPEAAREEHPGAPLRWVDLRAAVAQTAEDNFRQTLNRAESLLGSAAPAAS